jgi:hypothetical protein
MLEINVMKANAIVATLLVAAAIDADARFASPYPRKAVAPDDTGGWIAINGNAAPAARSPIRIDEGLSPSNRVGTAQDPNVHSASLASAPLSDATVGFVSVVSR